MSPYDKKKVIKFFALLPCLSSTLFLLTILLNSFIINKKMVEFVSNINMTASVFLQKF